MTTHSGNWHDEPVKSDADHHEPSSPSYPSSGPDSSTTSTSNRLLGLLVDRQWCFPDTLASLLEIDGRELQTILNDCLHRGHVASMTQKKGDALKVMWKITAEGRALIGRPGNGGRRQRRRRQQGGRPPRRDRRSRSRSRSPSRDRRRDGRDRRDGGGRDRERERERDRDRDRRRSRSPVHRGGRGGPGGSGGRGRALSSFEEQNQSRVVNYLKAHTSVRISEIMDAEKLDERTIVNILQHLLQKGEVCKNRESPALWWLNVPDRSGF